MIFSSDYSCIWHVVYHNRKISINFREMVSEITAVYSIVQVQSPNTLSSCLPSTSQLYWLSWKITSVKLNYSKSVRLDEIRLIDTQRTRLYSGGCNETVTKIVKRNWCNCFVFFNRNRCNCFTFQIGPNVTVTLLNSVLM